MKLIDYDKNRYKDSSPRASIWYAVVSALCCGVFLGMALMEASHGETWAWMLPLALAFSSGVQTLHSTLLVLHYFPPSTRTSSPNSKIAIFSER